MSLPLGIIDIVVLVLAVFSSVVIGLRFRGKNSSVEAYLLGDRNLPWWAILGSIVATETSTATVLSVPGHGFGEVGFKFLQLAMGFVLGRVLVVVFLLPGYFEGKLMSAYEILGTRFGIQTKRIASVLFLVTRNLGDGLRLFLAAMVLQELVGWPLVWSAVAIGVITMLYTYVGGMRSVVWNDCVQFVIYMIGSIAAVFVIVSYLPNGWSSFFEYAKANNKFAFIDPQFSLTQPYTLWAGLVGGAALSLGSHGTDQMMVQRYLSSRSQRDAARAVLWSGVVVFAQFALFLFIGMLLACFYSTQETLPAGIKNDAIFSHFMIHSFPANTGLIGLMLAAILAAVMSTLSSSLSASASSVVSDLWLPSCTVLPSESRQVWTTRLLTIFFGGLQIAIGVWASTFNKSVIDNALTIAGFSSGILLGLFALGTFTKRANQMGALCGATIGLCVMLFIQFGLPLWNMKIAGTLLAVFGSVTTYFSGLGISLVTAPSLERTNP
ncbi:MAG: sodium:solute symporter [Planctomycetota bacterium]|nr:sodium:solute symporter [Planctomycetota bacterium]